MNQRFTSAKRGVALTATALLATTVLAACGSDDGGSSGSANDKTFTLAFVGALSGPGAASGRTAADGLKAGVNYVNSLGGDVTFKYEERDSKGDPSTGANLARELAQSGVDTIYTSSTEIAAIQPVLNQYKILGADSGGVTGLIPKLGTNNEYPWTFSTSTAAGSLSILPLVTFAQKTSGGGPVGEIADNGPYGTGQTAATDKLVKDQFPGLKLEKQEFAATATSVTAQLTKLKNAGVKSLVVWTYGAPLIMVMQSLDRMGWYPYVATVLSIGDPSVIAATPAGLKGKIVGGGIAASQVEGSGKAAGELTKQFFDAYAKVKGSQDFNALDTVGSYTFDWAVSVNAAIVATKATDATKLRDWLVKGDTIQGAQGPIKFGDEGAARIGISPDNATVFDPSQPCSGGVCQPVKTT